MASARIVIGLSLALFPFGWRGSTPIEFAVILPVAAIVTGLGVLQMARPRLGWLPGLAAKIDAPIAVRPWPSTRTITTACCSAWS